MIEQSNFEKLIKDIQKKIDKDEEATYSKKVIYEYRNPTFFGNIKNPDASATIKGSCGDTMRIDIKIKNYIISDIRFWTDGCGPSVASGNMLSKMMIGKSLKQAKNFTKKQLLDSLDGLPKENLHCSKLAIDTLHLSINNYLNK